MCQETCDLLQVKINILADLDREMRVICKSSGGKNDNKLQNIAKIREKLGEKN